MTGNGANEFTVEELERLFGDNPEQETPPANEEQNDAQQDNVSNDDASKSDNNNVETTKAFAKRLKESTDKARLEERDAIAKTLGYNSYDELIKSQENNVLKDKGLDPEEVSPIIEELVKKRIDADPRMQELAELKKQQIEDFGRKELAEITKLTGGEITSLTQLPKEVISRWKEKGSLKAAYLELEGEKLITKMRSEQSKGSTEHLKSPSGSETTPSNKRHLSNEEKQTWLFFNPGTSKEDLDKILVDK